MGHGQSGVDAVNHARDYSASHLQLMYIPYSKVFLYRLPSNALPKPTTSRYYRGQMRLSWYLLRKIAQIDLKGTLLSHLSVSLPASLSLSIVTMFKYHVHVVNGKSDTMIDTVLTSMQGTAINL